MRPTFLKPSMVEPNFAFGLGVTGTDTGQPALGTSSSPDSAEYHSDHSQFVLHKTDKSLHHYRMTSGETLQVGRSHHVSVVEGNASFREKLLLHLQQKWSLYVIITLGLVSISGCIAAGVALAAVQPYLMNDSEPSTEPPIVLFPQRSNFTGDDSDTSQQQSRQDEQLGAGASETTTADPSPEDRLPQSPPTESPIPLRRAASSAWNGAQEPPAPPELLANPNPADLAAPSVRELYSTLEASASTSAGEQSRGDRRALTATIQGVNLMNPDSRRFFTATVTAGLPASVPGTISLRRPPAILLPMLPDRLIPVPHIVESIPARDKMMLFQQTGQFFTAPPAIYHRNTSPLLYFEDKREPDRFPDHHVRKDAAATAVTASRRIDPLSQDLNITFVDPYAIQAKKPLLLLARRSLVKRSVTVVQVGGSRDQPGPGLNLGRFTMMQPSVRMVGVISGGSKNGSKNSGGEGRLVPVQEPKTLLPDAMLCEAGYEWSVAARDCHDVDECLQMGIRACGVHSECTNSPGTYTCRCNPGFRLDPKSLVCTDIDECKESNGECSPLAQCLNLPGGFVCRCSDGFYGNGIVCEIDGNPAVDRRDSAASLPCQASLPPRTHQVVSSPYHPEPFPVHSRYKFCVLKMHGVCKMSFTVQHFIPSATSHQDFDHLIMQGKVLTGTDLNGQTLWLLDSSESPVEIEFATDSDLKGNRFTLEIAQEQCGQLLSVPECSELLNVEGNAITSAGPHYIDNVACTTALYPPHDACGIELTFHEFGLEGPRETCLYDYLEINDDKLCGNLKNEIREIIFPRNTPKIPIIFSTDASFVSQGFNISFVWITECYQ